MTQTSRRAHGVLHVWDLSFDFCILPRACGPWPRSLHELQCGRCPSL